MLSVKTTKTLSQAKTLEGKSTSTNKARILVTIRRVNYWLDEELILLHLMEQGVAIDRRSLLTCLDELVVEQEIRQTRFSGIRAYRAI